MTTDGARHDGLRAAAVLAAAVAQVVGSPLGSALAGRGVGAVSDETGSLITPAGYAFSIWGVIFAGSLAWAVYQALPAQRGRTLHRRTGWPLAAAFAGNAAWEIAFPLVGVSVPLVPLVLLLCIVAATAVAWARLQDLPVEGLGRVLPAAVTGLLLGWVTVAAAVNAGQAGVALGAPASGTTAQVWAVVVLAVVALIASALVLAARDAAGPFALAVVWGLVAVAVAGPPAPVVVAALAAASAVAVTLVVRTVVHRDPVSLLVG
ncbi:hypothetical protein E9549_14505 [Blastococcus sp. MG754426]|uniref:hypothetical protein n=1 Tax=unclassified Blastococcus TaxID=2619396 RepID=UPI001EF075B0|nr:MULTISPECIES: hypothetical protein [unclassified Blastococcus]MCF6508607.1 hypothetical protein [Blastococcus sp. MG754426]MCF6513236.1 hypothetical protein [Blastococcus sp. MG754427]